MSPRSRPPSSARPPRRRAGARGLARAPSRGAGRVRVIGGEWRGRRLEVADVPGLRPTGDRVRETLFNWLRPHVPGARCLDLFAGSGALGFEAASRGAAAVTLVERDPRACTALAASIAAFDAAPRVRLVRGAAESFLLCSRDSAASVPAVDAARPGTVPSAPAPVDAGPSDAGPFDLVFVDPPFDVASQPDVLAALAESHLADGARVYVEAPARQAWPGTLPGALALERERTFGEVVARVLRNG